MNEKKTYAGTRVRGYDHRGALVHWPPGHIIGWEHAFVHQLHHLAQAILGEGAV
jgi:hypothetical protein